MKKISRFFIVPALAAAALACTNEKELNEVQTPVNSAPKEIVVNAVLPESSLSKTVISASGDAYKIAWEGSEDAKLVQRNNKNTDLAIASSTGVTVNADGSDAAFTFSAPASVDGATYNYDIFTPASAVKTNAGQVVTLTVPSSQTPGATTVDPAATILLGNVAGDFDAQPASVDASFSHLMAYVKMNLKEASSGGATISSVAVSITAEDCNIAGDLTYDTASGDVNYNAGSESTINIDGANLTYAYAGFDVWFACKPFTLPAGKTLSITTTFNGGEKQTTSTLKLAKDVTFKAGYVTELPAYGTTVTVTFNTQGGSTIAPVSVPRGKKVSAPADPTKTGALAEGFYLGDFPDPDNADYVFGGWYTDAACTTPYDFDSQLWSNQTLYAKWTPEKIDLSSYADGGNDWNAGSQLPYKAFNYLADQGAFASETNYTIVMNSNCTVWNGSLSLNKANAVVRWVGKSSERTMTRNGCYTVVNVLAGTLIMGKNIKCSYTGGQNYPFFNVNGAGAGLVFDDGFIFDGDGKTLPAGNAVIDVNGAGASFVLDGGLIQNCTVNNRLVNVKNATAQFIIRDGSISGNTFNGVLFETFYGSGKDHIFVMEGGSISSNVFTTSLINLKSATAELLLQGGEISSNTASTGADQAAPIIVTNGRLDISGGSISNNSVESTSATANVAGAILIVGWADNADSNFYVQKSGGVVGGNSASRTVAADATGFRGDQMLYVQKTAEASGFKKKRDADVTAAINFTSNPYDGFWANATAE